MRKVIFFIFIFLFHSVEMLFAQNETLPDFFFSQVGEASYYGNEFNNRKTSSGEIYRKNEFTAAHPFLAFGTSLKVTNLRNNKTTIIRVNDRGPHIKGRIIDLSYAAAKQLDILRHGVAKVKIETLSEPKEDKLNEVVLYDDQILKGEEYYVLYESALDSTKVNKIISANGKLKIGLYRHQVRAAKSLQTTVFDSEKIDTKENTKNRKQCVHSVQVGAFVNYDNADELQNLLIQKKYKDIEIISIKEKDKVLYRVIVGTFGTPEEANKLKNKLLADYLIGFVIKNEE